MEDFKLSKNDVVVDKKAWIPGFIKKRLQEVEVNELFYDINDDTATLKMDVVANYIKNIKDKEYNDLVKYSFAWIMAVQIALRSPKIGGNNGDKFGSIIIDGFRGPETKEAIKKFQKEYNLKVDGRPGKETLNKIYEILTGETVVSEGRQDSGKDGEGNVKNSDLDSDVTRSGTDTGAGSGTDGGSSLEKEPNDSDVVPVKKYIPDIKYDLKYATSDNSFGKKIYSDGESNLKLRYEAVKKLSKAQEILKEQGYQLKIWDAYRPDEAQKMMRDSYRGPEETKSSNVAIPKGVTYKGKKGTGSNHGTGTAVDLTMVDSNGNEVQMSTNFDEFNGSAAWGHHNASEQSRKNAFILRRAMERAGFYTIKSEWWHYQTNKGRSTLSHLA